ncbi:MAG TPA: histidine phosphatase family protein [Gemmatimonadaceae bacterium]|nr:histidine phosphatase family protein [Gemmatimonadaceae bacterium]
MELLVVRHATAEDKDAFARTGEDDDLRPLTPGGQREMREVTRALRELVPEIHALATSPLVRAVQTAEILGSAYGREPALVEWLRPEAEYEAFAQWARAHREKKMVVIVGHEPHLSGLVSWLIAGGKRTVLQLKKAGACLLEVEGKPGAGSGTLIWSMGPKHLRPLGKG